MAKPKPNPGELIVMGNPPRRGKRGRRLGRVHLVRYRHDTEGLREHKFRGDEVVEGLPDGSLRIYSPDGAPLWADF